MDGNGRWAEQRGLARVEGHQAGVAAVRASVQFCLKKKIPILSLFAFSAENWSRPMEEVDFLMGLFVKTISKELDELHEHGVRLRFIGDRTKLSSLLQMGMEQAEVVTRNNTALTLNIAVNYSGKWDVLQAVKTVIAQIELGEKSVHDLNESAFSSLLSTSEFPDPDLFIRTSGELRISNFFLWQLAYTELYFSALPWPDFTIDEFENALNSFSGRERRFGQLSQQSNGSNHV